jgi:dihydroorotate dehydrogenase (fumarate)
LIPALRADHPNRVLIGSVAGLAPDDFGPIADALMDGGVSALEVNLSCPNVIGKPQLAYDFDASEAVIRDVASRAAARGIPVGVKLPPYPDLTFNTKMATILETFGIQFVVAINSVPHACIVDVDTEEFVIKNKYGGLGGRAILPVAVGQVR